MAAQLIEVTPDVLCIRRPSYFTCSYLVRQPDGLVAVDAGMDSDGADLLAGLRYWNSTPKDLRAILLTHWHNDHAAGAAELQQAGAAIYYHRGDQPELTRRTARPGLRGWFSEQIPEVGPLVLLKGLLGEATPRAVQADRCVNDGDIIAGGFEVVHTPGHTPGHVSYYHGPRRILFAGDALAVIGDQIRYMARPVTPDRALARESMKRILRLDSEILCPGHREPLTSGVHEQRTRMLRQLDQGGRWPWLG